MGQKEDSLPLIGDPRVFWYHITTRFCAGATSVTSHCSWISLPSSGKSNMCVTLRMETSSGVSGKTISRCVKTKKMIIPEFKRQQWKKKWHFQIHTVESEVELFLTLSYPREVCNAHRPRVPVCMGVRRPIHVIYPPPTVNLPIYRHCWMSVRVRGLAFSALGLSMVF